MNARHSGESGAGLLGCEGTDGGEDAAIYTPTIVE
jgi:hypothetical protein